ncbi:Phosphate regulon transcriptional regulatory protein PhoB (SphR) [hydrothermal vent metagenome]|uniref:Phosphate regulon transcriptional regulatory protein PhoB (SphR) n=1 Tax=hydrothermal vent metagenome TaxID=652676 RepID=A0A3B1DVN9_9ZZZZ
MPTTKKILIVEDERDLAELIAMQLERAGYAPHQAHDGRTGLQKATEIHPDLILLDVMLPELTGIEVAQRLRVDPATAAIPIIMLTAKAAETDEVAGLSAGADDYITKPFSLSVLLARLETVLRRAGAENARIEPLIVGPIEVQPTTHRVLVDQKEVLLTPTEFRLLTCLLMDAGTVLSRQVLMQKAIGPGVRVTPRTIDVHITALRRKLGHAGQLLETVRGIGYRIEDPAPATPPTDTNE